eukprot:11226695-Lingulodinium_polyedra.AAC.1
MCWAIVAAPTSASPSGRPGRAWATCDGRLVRRMVSRLARKIARNCSRTASPSSIASATVSPWTNN